MEWKYLSITEKFKLLLPGIKAGKKNTVIADELGISEKTVRTIIDKNGFKRDKKDNRILIKLSDINENSECITDAIQENTIVDIECYTDVIQDQKTQDNECITNAIQTTRGSSTAIIEGIEIESLKEIISMKNELRNVIQWYSKSISNNEIVELEPVEIKLDERIGVVGKAVGMRIDEDIYKEWLEFTKEHNKRFKSHQLLSQALLDFIKKYK